MHCIKAGGENPDVVIDAGYVWVFDPRLEEVLPSLLYLAD